MANTALLTALGALGAGYGGYAKQLEEAERKRVADEERQMRQSELDRAFNLQLDQFKENVRANEQREELARKQLAQQGVIERNRNIGSALNALIQGEMVTPTGNLPSMFGVNLAPQASRAQRSIDDLMGQGFSYSEAYGLMSGRFKPEEAMAMRSARIGGASGGGFNMFNNSLFAPPAPGDTNFISRRNSMLPPGQ